jgi:hypothetical protein
MQVFLFLLTDCVILSWMKGRKYDIKTKDK